MNKQQFKKFWWLKAMVVMAAVLVFVAACGSGSDAVGGQGATNFVVSPTQQPIVVDLQLSWVNSTNIQLAEGDNASGVLVRVTNKTGVEFVKGELMYLSGGVLVEFSPTRMEFSITNKLFDPDIVNSMFIKLTAEDGSTSTCVTHLIVENTASMSCTGFSAQ